MKIAIVGSGFVGTATGSGLAKHGNDITFIDILQERVDQLKKLGFKAVLSAEHTRLDTDITMFCVPTPTDGGSINLEIIQEAVKTFARKLATHDQYHVVVIRSTVPPGTTRRNLIPLIEKHSGKKAGVDFGVCMQPEYLREATANQDFARPWFILIGELDNKSGSILEKVYKPFDAPIEHVGLDEAEFQKYVHNVFNAVKIAFMNEMRLIGKIEKWDVDAIMHATAQSCEGLWNPMYGLRDYGPFDGSCLPKDTRALLEWGDKNGYKLEILRSVIKENMRHEKLLGKNTSVRVNYLDRISV